MGQMFFCQALHVPLTRPWRAVLLYHPGASIISRAARPYCPVPERPPPLRTVQVPFDAYGSSIGKEKRERKEDAAHCWATRKEKRTRLIVGRPSNNPENEPRPLFFLSFLSPKMSRVLFSFSLFFLLFFLSFSRWFGCSLRGELAWDSCGHSPLRLPSRTFHEGCRAPLETACERLARSLAALGSAP